MTWRQSGSNHGDSLQWSALPLEEALDEEFEDDGASFDAMRYLYSVRDQAKGLPDIVVAESTTGITMSESNDRNFTQERPRDVGVEGWKDRFVELFIKQRQVSYMSFASPLLRHRLCVNILTPLMMASILNYQLQEIKPTGKLISTEKESLGHRNENKAMNRILGSCNASVNRVHCVFWASFQSGARMFVY